MRMLINVQKPETFQKAVEFAKQIEADQPQTSSASVKPEYMLAARSYPYNSASYTPSTDENLLKKALRNARGDENYANAV